MEGGLLYQVAVVGATSSAGSKHMFGKSHIWARRSDELRISLYRLPPFISRGRSRAGLLRVGDLITQEVSQCI